MIVAVNWKNARDHRWYLVYKESLRGSLGVIILVNTSAKKKRTKSAIHCQECTSMIIWPDLIFQKVEVPLLNSK